MSVRVVARIRPLLKAELDRDIIVQGTSSSDNDSNEEINTIRIPNPRNEGEDFSFQFNSVYDMQATQEDIFQNEGTKLFLTRGNERLSDPDLAK
jgi:hypothetical protein